MCRTREAARHALVGERLAISEVRAADAGRRRRSETQNKVFKGIIGFRSFHPRLAEPERSTVRKIASPPRVEYSSNVLLGGGLNSLSPASLGIAQPAGLLKRKTEEATPMKRRSACFHHIPKELQANGGRIDDYLTFQQFEFCSACRPREELHTARPPREPASSHLGEGTTCDE